MYASMATGRRLRAARLSAGLTCTQIAKECGVTISQVAHWERGKLGKMQLKHLAAIANATHTDVWSLAFEGISGDESYNEWCGEIISLFKQLDWKAQHELLSIAKASVEASAHYRKFAPPP